MKAPAHAWAMRFDALGRRERALVAIGAILAIVLVAYVVLIDPALARARSAERRAQELQAQALAARERSKTLQALHNGPEIAARSELEALRKQLGAVADRLAGAERSLVPPRDMPWLLEDMLGRNRLRLVSVRTLPVVPLTAKGAEIAGKADQGAVKTSKANTAALYRHGIEVKVEGSYEDLVAYLERLEKSKMKLIWNGVSLATDTHPRLVLTLTVFTLSLDKTWLIV